MTSQEYQTIYDNLEAYLKEYTEISGDYDLFFICAPHGHVMFTVVKEPDLARAICQRYPAKIVMALDARDGKLAVEGWQEQSQQDVTELAREVDGWNIAAILFTNIRRDGTREGPDVEATAELQSNVSTTVIASGGIGALDDLRALAAAGVRASVCGRALYSGAFTLSEAFASLEPS